MMVMKRETLVCIRKTAARLNGSMWMRIETLPLLPTLEANGSY